MPRNLYDIFKQEKWYTILNSDFFFQAVCDLTAFYVWPAFGISAYMESDACSLPHNERKPLHPLEEPEIKEFMQAIEKDERYKNLYIVTLFTGVRLREICGLPWSSVDFNRGTICIRQQLSKERGKGGKYYIATTKNNKSRIITPAPFVMTVLKEVKREQAENRSEPGKHGETNGILFLQTR